MHSCLLDAKTVVGTNVENGYLYKADLLKGKIVYKKEDSFFKVIDNQMRYVYRIV